jgi:hypothetical protein
MRKAYAPQRQPPVKGKDKKADSERFVLRLFPPPVRREQYRESRSYGRTRTSTVSPAGTWVSHSGTMMSALARPRDAI